MSEPREFNSDHLLRLRDAESEIKELLQRTAATKMSREDIALEAASRATKSAVFWSIVVSGIIGGTAVVIALLALFKKP